MKNISFVDFGTLASILGFILTLIILFNLRKIKKSFLFKIRVPDISKRLNDIMSNISNLMNDYENSKESIDLEVAKCEVALRSLKRKTSGSTKKSIKKLIQKLNDYQNKPNEKTKENLWNIYVNNLKIIEETKEMQEDYKWEK